MLNEVSFFTSENQYVEIRNIKGIKKATLTKVAFLLVIKLYLLNHIVTSFNKVS